MNNLTPMQQQVIALLKLQNECAALERDFHQKLFELECEFNVNHEKIYAKRAKIVTGEGELLKDDYNFDGIDLGAVNKFSLCDNNNVESVKGVPMFWLNVLKNSSVYPINSDDEAILCFLIDMKLTMEIKPKPYFELIFVFAKNPFFENSILTKRFFIEFADKFDETFSYEGARIVESFGTEIHWNEEVKSLYNNENEQTFFQFFNSSRRGDGDEQNVDDFNATEDFEAGLQMKDHVIPNAVLYYLTNGDDVNSISSKSSSGGHSDDAAADADETILNWYGKESLNPIKLVMS